MRRLAFPAFMLILTFVVWQGIDLVYNVGRLMALAETVEAQGQSPTELQGEVSGFETLAPGATAIGFTAATAANARAAFCTVETVSIRYRMDGTAPTTSVGHLQLSSATSNVAYWFAIVGRNKVIAFRMIATSGTSSVTCSYLR